MKEAEVDQSGKIEDTEVDTILALANGLSWTIRIPASVKRAGLAFLRQRHVSRKTRYLRMLAGGLYLLLCDYLDQLSFITIDVEFAGRENDLRGMLLVLLWRKLPPFSKERVIFHRVGKKSPAHHLALMTYQGKKPAGKTITEKEFIGALK